MQRTRRNGWATRLLRFSTNATLNFSYLHFLPLPLPFLPLPLPLLLFRRSSSLRTTASKSSLLIFPATNSLIASLTCDGANFDGTVTASPWARQVANIASYRYSGATDANAMMVEALDSGEATLATLVIRQVEEGGEAPLPDGAIGDTWRRHQRASKIASPSSPRPALPLHLNTNTKKHGTRLRNQQRTTPSSLRVLWPQLRPGCGSIVLRLPTSPSLPRRLARASLGVRGLARRCIRRRPPRRALAIHAALAATPADVPLPPSYFTHSARARVRAAAPRAVLRMD